MIKVSVIIPIYNVEKYLEDCLNSVINQTLKDIEIICIDDCSTDNSVSILEEFAKKDNRIIILKNEENRGAGYTRNVGMKNSNGEYIGFIDSDDYISKDYFENLYNTAKKYNSDLINTLNIFVNDKDDVYPYWFSIHNMSPNDKESYYEYDKDIPLYDVNRYCKYCITYNPVNKIYKKSFIFDKKIFFKENKICIGEDGDFIMRILLNTNKISFNNIGQYYYRMVNSSSINKSKSNFLYCLSSIEHMENTLDYCKSNFPALLNYLYPRVWMSPLYQFRILDKENQKKIYIKLHQFANELYINKYDYDDINQFNYEEFILIKLNSSYNKYFKNKNLLNNSKKTNNEFKLFLIEKDYNYIKIIILGIKISIKRKHDK